LKRRSKYAGNLLAGAYLALQAWKLRRFERKTAAMFGHHTTCSGADKETLLQDSRDARVEVVPNGVDTEFFSNTGDTERPNTLIYVGGMTWHPNHDAMRFFIEEILPLLKKEVPDIEMTHIGRQTGDEFFRKAEREKALRILGFVDDIRPELSRAAVYVVPLRIGGGTRLKVLDALSMGCAIVSTSIGCEGIDVTDGKDIIIADDAESFARKTVEVLSDTELRQRLRENARKLAEEKYSWKTIAPKLERVYQQLASSSLASTTGTGK
jgi:glycosyltransferase involved in cell wall biosynthesis